MTLSRFDLNRFDSRSVEAFTVLRSAPASFGYGALHPIPNPTMPDDPEPGFMARVAREVLPPVRATLGARSTRGA